MANGHKPLMFKTAIEGWRLAFEAFSRMPMVFGIAIVLVFILNAVTTLLAPAPSEEPGLGAQLLLFVVSVVQGFLLAPVAIAVHRYVLLGEVTGYYMPNPADPRFMHFFLFTVVYQLLTNVPSALMSVAMASQTTAGGVLAFIFFVLLIAALIVCLRLLIMFPAIAVDAPAADWRNAYWDSKGNSWRIFWIVVLTAIPGMLIVLPFYFLLAWPSGPGLFGGIVLAALQAVVGVIMVAAFAAVASKLYAAFAARLRGEAPA